MKKITVLILVLGLAMPVNAWTLFPVREKTVIVEKTKISYVACVISSVITLILGGIIMFSTPCSEEEKISLNFLRNALKKYNLDVEYYRRTNKLLLINKTSDVGKTFVSEVRMKHYLWEEYNRIYPHPAFAEIPEPPAE
jgi:hypothetical protein